LKVRKSDFDLFEFEEAEAFIAGAAEHAPEWHPFVVVAMRTKIRELPLTWDAIAALRSQRERVQPDAELVFRQVQEWLGHGSIVVTMRYSHLAAGIGDDLIRRLAPPPQGADTPSPDAARLQHMGDPRNPPSSKLPSYTPVGD
jgi:hypothetical protein